MCGIFAYFGNKFTEHQLSNCLPTIKHRGPDFSNYYYKENAFLGHTRLSIIDLESRSNQPYIEDQYLMVFNGEIYNYKELVKEHHLNCSTLSDTEVLLKMYIKYKERCLKFLNGMFAFVIYNTETKDIFICRDRLGIKPLYISDTDKGLLICSEINAIQNLINSELDNFSIRQYKKLRMTVKGHTVYEKIQMFPAGKYKLNNDFKEYWSYQIEKRKAPSDEELKYLIEDAVKIRTRSDVPLGIYLSGGLDSTILTYLVKPQHTWTVGFKELNEFNWGRLAADDLGSQHHETLVDKETFVDVAKKMIASRKEPLCVPNEVLIYLMTQNVKKENTVVLSGEGADELFWGYDRIFKWANSSHKFSLEEFDKHYCYGSHEDDEVIDFALNELNYKDPIDIVGHYFQTTHLQGLLRRLDNSTMLCSVEARVPFVDHRLVELMAGTPFEWKMGNSFKEPLKRIFSDILPKKIIDRKKVGFPVPMSSIFKNVPGKKEMDSWLDFNINELTKN